MKHKDFERLCGELRLGKLTPGFQLSALHSAAADGVYELKMYTESLLEAYARVCADRAILREMLRKCRGTTCESVGGKTK